MKAQAVEILLRVLAHFPLRLQRVLGRMLGTIIYRLNGKTVRISRRNIELCFPGQGPEHRETLVRRSIIETVTMVFEASSVWFRGVDWQDRHILAFENRKLFDEALASGRGMLLLIPHFGNWELAAIWASRFVIGTALYRTPRAEFLDPLLRKVRNLGKSTLVPATTRGVLAVVKALQRGETTVILPDQEPAREGGRFSDFFGQPALTMTLIHRLVVKTSPSLLVVYARREPGGLVVGFLEPDSAVYSEDEQVSVDALNRTVEALVMTAPEQYQWEYKRFRKAPEGVAPRYLDLG
jgi:Kdo2-lipid IVA lauroyltransferase/acyltransferase